MVDVLIHREIRVRFRRCAREAVVAVVMEVRCHQRICFVQVCFNWSKSLVSYRLVFSSEKTQTSVQNFSCQFDSDDECVEHVFCFSTRSPSASQFNIKIQSNDQWSSTTSWSTGMFECIIIGRCPKTVRISNEYCFSLWEWSEFESSIELRIDQMMGLPVCRDVNSINSRHSTHFSLFFDRNVALGRLFSSLHSWWRWLN